MKHLVKVIVVNTITLSSAHALIPKAPFVVYGTDDRHEVYQASATHKKWAQSTAVLVKKTDLKLDPKGTGLVQLDQRPLTDYLKIFLGAEACSDMKYAQQPNPGQCSGFLIAPDLMVTAGHCIEIDNFCEDYQWVFDFEVDPKTKQAGLNIKPENVFSCKKVVSYKLNGRTNVDFGVVLLDRKVPDRASLTLAAQGKISDTQELVVIGNPSGLPTKVATGAAVRSNGDENFFVANLDTFAGNSGSAVFNAGTGVVEGILVRGEEDYVENEVNKCMEVNVCDSDACRGEDVSRMTSIPEVKHAQALKTAAQTGDVKALEKLMLENLWVDFHGQDGKTALMLAASANKAEALKVLLAAGADATITDSAEETALHALVKSSAKNAEESLSLLVQAGVKLEAKNAAGDTALLLAAKAQDLNSVVLLLKNGADAHAVDKNGENLLFTFARAGDLDALITLRNLGVDLKPVTPIVGKNLRLKRFFRNLFKPKHASK